MNRSTKGVVIVLIVAILLLFPIFASAQLAAESQDQKAVTVENPFLQHTDKSVRKVQQMEIKRYYTNQVVTVTDTVVIDEILAVLQSLDMYELESSEWPKEFMEEMLRYIENPPYANAAELTQYIKLTCADGTQSYVYMQSQHVIYENAYSYFGHSNLEKAFYQSIEGLLQGSPVSLDWPYREKWPDSVWGSNGDRQINTIIVSTNPLGYKTITNPDELQQLTDLMRSMKLTSGEHFLYTDSSLQHNDPDYALISEEYRIATIFGPNLVRSDPKIDLPPADYYRDDPCYPIYLKDGVYYLGYSQFHDLTIDTKDAEALIALLYQLDYPLQADTKEPHWWTYRRPTYMGF